jgi:hypothetical protein
MNKPRKDEMKGRIQGPPRENFRVPNSIIQGLTTSTPADLNRLPPFSTTVLLGLVGLVDPRHPAREVRARPSDILEMIEVGKRVAHAVDREWATAAGALRRRRYRARRYSPRQLEHVHEALLALHDQKVTIQRWDPRAGVKLEDRTVHLLDMFGYAYERGGRAGDVDDLPPDRVKVNVGTPERPVWRLRRQTVVGERDERPSGILFRLNAELARELAGVKGSIHFTLLARQVFGVLRLFCRDAGAIRLLLLVLRQTAAEFRRPLDGLLDDMGWAPGHPARALARLEKVLCKLRELAIVTAFEIDRERGQVLISRNVDWHNKAAPVPTADRLTPGFLAREKPFFGT